jgi:3-phosphoshikimate 1-carboxyvinyltransferase
MKRNLIYTVHSPQLLPTTVRLPASKSISNRILILNALSKSAQTIENLSISDDTQALLTALQLNRSTVDVGAAGTAMRFLTAYFSQLPGNWTLTGTERMKNRPVKILVNALKEIGGTINYLEKEGFPPLHIQGKSLQGGRINLDGSVSSQYLSALMMIAPCMRQGLNICLEGTVISQPYIEMTRQLMETFGVGVRREGQVIRIPSQSYQAKPFTVESDWSAASYWYEIVALAKNPVDIELIGLKQNSVQGDAKVAALFESLGVETNYNKANPVISGRATVPDLVNGCYYYDFTNEPDLAQTLAVTCCLSDIPFHFTGLQSLRIKETDRITALQTELKKLGYRINCDETAIKWTGERCDPLPNPVISTYEDHRMAMAFAPACLKTGKISIRHPEVVSKSYPHFWNDLEKAGFTVVSEETGQ